MILDGTGFEKKRDPRFGPIDMVEFMRPTASTGKYRTNVMPGDTTAFSIADPEGNLVALSHYPVARDP